MNLKSFFMNSTLLVCIALFQCPVVLSEIEKCEAVLCEKDENESNKNFSGYDYHELAGKNFKFLKIETYDHGKRLVFEIPKTGGLGLQGKGPVFGGPFLEFIERYPERTRHLGFEIDRNLGLLKHPDLETLVNIVEESRKSSLTYTPQMGIALYNGRGEAPLEYFLENLKDGLVTISSGEALYTLHDLHIHLLPTMILPREIVSRVQYQADLLMKVLRDPVLSKNKKFRAVVFSIIRNFVDAWDRKSYGLGASLTDHLKLNKSKRDMVVHYLKTLGEVNVKYSLEQIASKLSPLEKSSLEKILSGKNLRSITEAEAVKLMRQIYNDVTE